MPVARFQMPDGRVARFEVPDGTTPEQAQALIQSQLGGAKESSLMDDLKQGAVNLAAGAVRGAGSIGSTILAPFDMAKDALDGKGVSLESNRERRAKIDAGLRSLVGADPESITYKAGKLGGEIAGTAGVGGVLGNVAGRALPASYAPLVEAVSTSGFKAGGATGPLNMLTRVVGGAITGGASAGLVNPEEAPAGFAIGGVMPPAVSAAGAVGGAIGRKIAGPKMPAATIQAAQGARQAGYVVPPTQVKPSLVNRVLEGASGKITTAQNASAKNQEVTNELAKKAIGAAELTPQGIQAVRDAANRAYDDLAQVGTIQADNAFQNALQQAGSMSAQLKKDFPELVNSEVEGLVQGLASRPQFEAQSVIEAIKRLRFDGSANKIAQDPGKKALGKAQMNIANALEDLVDRNLQAIGQPDLLKGYREARTTLAKVYDVEKALNSSSGNVDARKIGSLLDKKRPLTGELKQIGEFANTFPKAAQMPEKMGSLPQLSPLDFGVGVISGNPLMMIARPAARSMILSGPVQNRMVAPSSNRLAALLANPEVEQLAFRSAPVLATSR